ncbi:hypothetical protein ACHAW6_007474 [Cyclotella cf. meneghiniana]
MTHANAAVDNSQWPSQMITSLDNLANAAVQKNNRVEQLVVANKQLTNTIAKLQEDNTKLLNIIQQLAGHTPQSQGTTTKWDPKGYCHTHGFRVNLGHNSKTCRYKMPSKDYKIINSVYFTPGCANPPNLNTTTLLGTAANIPLLTPNAPALQDETTLPAMPLFPDQNLPSQQKRHIAYQVSLIICYLQSSLQMEAVKYFFTRQGARFHTMEK